MKVKLIQHTSDPERLIAASAKLCYSSVGVEDILEGLDAEKTDKFLGMLMELGHESPIEHVAFTFAAEGISRVLTHQLVRHRIGCSYSQQSQRYVKLEQFEYIIPPAIAAIPAARERFIKAMEYDQQTYNELADMLFHEHLERFIREGKTEKQARQLAEKSSIEDARYVFPNACETKLVFTMNARAIMNFLRHRCCSRAQWEIRELADEMLKQLKEAAPVLFKNAGPACVCGPCPEGAMTCGNAKEIKEKYRSL